MATTNLGSSTYAAKEIPTTPLSTWSSAKPNVVWDIWFAHNDANLKRTYALTKLEEIYAKAACEGAEEVIKKHMFLFYCDNFSNYTLKSDIRDAVFGLQIRDQCEAWLCIREFALYIAEQHDIDVDE